jgi:abequosyltransferase
MEVVVSDNASTDDTKAVVEEFSHRFPAVTYHRWPENMGADRNYLKVIELARGEYCWLFGSDDAVRPGAVREVLGMLGQHTDICLFSRFDCTFDMVPTGQKYWLEPNIKERVFHFSDARDMHLYLQKSIALGALFSYLSSIVVRRGAWNSVTYDERYTGTAYSHAFILLSLVQRGCSLYYSPKPVVDCRLGNDSFAGNGVVRRMLLDFDGYCAIRDQVFCGDIEAQEGINKILLHEHPLIKLVYRLTVLNAMECGMILRALQGVKYPKGKWILLRACFKCRWLLKRLRWLKLLICP